MRFTKLILFMLLLSLLSACQPKPEPPTEPEQGQAPEALPQAVIKEPEPVEPEKQEEFSQVLGMVTGGKTGTYIKIGQDIEKLMHNKQVPIWVKSSAGSLDNIKRMNSQENAGMGIVQSDVLGFLNRKGQSTAKLKSIAKNLQAMFALYNEEVHVFAKKYIHSLNDLQGKRVAVGTQGSGTYMTALNLFFMLGVSPEFVFIPYNEALAQVLNGDIDAMFYVAGKPVSLFKKIEQHPEKSKLLENAGFLSIDNPIFTKEYTQAKLTNKEYSWLNKPVKTIAVKAMLVAYDFAKKAENNPYYQGRCEQIKKIAEAMRTNIKQLRRQGHPKWHQVNLSAKLLGWPKQACMDN